MSWLILILTRNPRVEHLCQSIAQEARNREEEEKGFYVYGPFQEHSQKVVEALSKIIFYEILFP